MRDVSIEIAAGQVTALLGPNGAGKSSLVLAVGGVLRLEGGSVMLDERELARKRPEKIRRAGVAIVPEGRRLLADADRRGQHSRRHLLAARASRRRPGASAALELFPELEKRLSAPARELVRRRAADGRAGPGARLRSRAS